MAKIYTKGNYFFIEKDNRLFEALSKEVLVKKLTPTSTVFYFSNINNWTNEGIDLVDMEDESGTAYTAATWEAFYIENTGKSNGGGSESNGAVNKNFVQTFQTTKNINTGNAQLIHLFPEITIQANKKVKLDIYVPTRSTLASWESGKWGGIYINVNVKVNGVWYNLGNTGHDGGVMTSGVPVVHGLSHQMLLDFITNLGLSETEGYTLQFELTGKALQKTVTINGSHDINKVGDNLGSRGALQTWASDQNYTHLIITELDR